LIEVPRNLIALGRVAKPWYSAIHAIASRKENPK
jgi:hypothetical protein